MLARELIAALLNTAMPADEVAACYRLPVNTVQGCRMPDTDQLSAALRWIKLVELAATETWRPVVGYEAYEVSTMGNVRRGGKLLKPGLNSHGYLTVNLRKDGKNKKHSMHRLVAAAFLGESKLHVLHADDDKTNNRLSNLSYGTNAKNVIDAIRTGAQHRYRTSAYFGVGWDSRKSKWRTQVTNKHVGYFDNEVDAAAAANFAIITSNCELPLNWLT